MLNVMDYSSQLRILKEVRLDGTVGYYIQRKFMWLFWIKATEQVGYQSYSFICFDALLKAQEFIKNHYFIQESIRKQKVIYKEIIEYNLD